jgi:phosphate transport system substrate-binding protein
VIRGKSIGVVTALGVALLVSACGSTGSSTSGAPTTQAEVQGQEGSICGHGAAGAAAAPSGIAKLDGAAGSLSGAGSTFVNPIMTLWSSDFQKAQGAQVAYQSIGSGGGVQQTIAKTVDFGASDAPMKDDELARAGGDILHVPLVFGAVVPTYNLGGQTSGLKFTGEVLGQIFANKITKWNDPAITALNPDATLPDQAIAVVHRSDGSGTTDIWTDYLTKASPTWTTTLGGADKSHGKDVAWPTGIGGKGNEGVSGAVSQTPGALGYVELTYALSQKLPVGWVRNKAGAFIQPCIETVTAAATDAAVPADLRFSLTDGPGTNAYPITGTTWALVHQNQTDAGKAKALVNFFTWIMDQGQKEAPALNYAPLSADLQIKAVAQIRKIQLNGQPVARP